MTAIDQAELGIAFDDLKDGASAGADRMEGAAPGLSPRMVPHEDFFSARGLGAPRSLVSPRLGQICWQTLKTTAPLIAGDVLALGVSGVVALGALSALGVGGSPVVRSIGAVVLAMLVLAYGLCGLYSALGVNPVLELRQLIQINSIGFVAAAAGGLLIRPMPVWCLVAGVMSVGLVPFCRATIRRWCARSNWWGHPTLVINTGKNPDAMVLALMRAPTSGFRPVAVTDPRGACRSALMPVVSDPDALEALVREKTIRYAVVSAPDPHGAPLAEIFNRYTPLIPHLVVLSDAPDLPSLWGASRSCGRLSGLEMRNGRMLAQLWVVKRGIDVIVAAIAMVLSLPLFAAIALAVKLTSRGPIFYGHSRIGFGGQWFMAWKFRTMHPNSEAVLHDYLDKHPEARAEWDRDHKLKVDPRVTPIGKFLRRTSLDEIPQVWNVLKGEMSLVGPRPIVAGEVCKYGNVFKKYSAVKPGITGMWQVSGRSEVSYDERVRLDEYYIANWSPWLDLYILAKTVIILSRRRGAY